MKKYKLKCKTFGDLNIGDVFEFDTSYYMRIGNVTTAHGVFNAVSLVSAYACYLADAIKVQKVDAVVVSTEKWNRRAVQIKHGRWTWERNDKIELSYGENAYEPIFRCSCCGRRIESYIRYDEPVMPEDMDGWNYCPNCGARMDEEAEQ